MNYLACILVTGIGATAILDLWSLARSALFNIPPPDFGLVGRWFAYMPQGRFHHVTIKALPAVKSERIIGWTMHYAIGIAFAALLMVADGVAWFENPTFAPAFFVGVMTVIAPFLLMHPGMGAGIAAARTPNPSAARIQSVIAHTFFGVGLYIAGRLANLLFL